jgi:hypothetical protein
MIRIAALLGVLIILTLIGAGNSIPQVQREPQPNDAPVEQSDSRDKCAPQPICRILHTPLTPAAPTPPAKDMARDKPAGGVFNDNSMAVIRRDTFRLPESRI